MALQLGTGLAACVGQAAVQVAAAHGAVEVAVFPHRFGRCQVAEQAPLDLERRRVGQHQAGQFIQVRHAGRLHEHLQIHARKLGGIVEHAFHPCLHAARACGKAQRIPRGLLAQRQHRSCQSFSGDARLAVGALQRDLHAVLAFGLRAPVGRVSMRARSA